jgi:hypothetical protein
VQLQSGRVCETPGNKLGLDAGLTDARVKVTDPHEASTAAPETDEHGVAAPFWVGLPLHGDSGELAKRMMPKPNGETSEQPALSDNGACIRVYASVMLDEKRN